MGDVKTVRLFEMPKLPFNIKVSAASVTGTRRYQEDSLLYQAMPDGVLGVVCDGMGGLAHGDKASSCAVHSLLHYFKTMSRTDVSMELYWKEAFRFLDEEVAGLKNSRGERLGAGTTIAAVFSDGRELTFASAGDSMIYLLRRGSFRELVRMHNYRWLLEEKLKGQRISLAEYQEGVKKGEALITYLGINGLEIWDCSAKSLSIEKGDKVILCSDGLYRALNSSQIQDIVESCPEEDFEKAALELIRAVFQGPPRNLDNISVLCFCFAD